MHLGIDFAVFADRAHTNLRPEPPVARSMKYIENALLDQGYSKQQGVYTRSGAEEPAQSAPEITWSALARDNPIRAAAGTNERDWFAKCPTFVDERIPDEEQLVLDAGCGYGRVAIPLLQTKRSIRLIGADASAVMLNLFCRLAQTQNIPDAARRLLLLHELLDRLPFADATFDRIYSSAVLLHNPYKDVEKILAEFYRLLKPGGSLILAGSFPNLMNLEGMQNFFYCKWMISATANGPVRPYTKEHVRALFHDWNETHVCPAGVTVLPRQIAKIPLPFGARIRRFNNWVEQRNFSFLSRGSLFTRYFDVIAHK